MKIGAGRITIIFLETRSFHAVFIFYRRDDVAPRGSSSFFFKNPPVLICTHRPLGDNAGSQFSGFLIYSHKNSHQQFNSLAAFSTHTHTLRWSSRKKENWWWHPIHSNTVEETKSIGYLINVASSQKDLLQIECKLQTDISDQHVHDSNNSIFISTLDCKKEYLVMTYVLRIGEWQWRSYLNLEPVIGQVNLNEIFSKNIAWRVPIHYLGWTCVCVGDGNSHDCEASTKRVFIRFTRFVLIVHFFFFFRCKSIVPWNHAGCAPRIRFFISAANLWIKYLSWGIWCSVAAVVAKRLCWPDDDPHHQRLHILHNDGLCCTVVSGSRDRSSDVAWMAQLRRW